MRKCVSCKEKVDALNAVVSGDGVIHESCLEEEREHSGLTEDVTGRIAGSGYPSRWGDKKA